jgi:hypothetical protein
MSVDDIIKLCIVTSLVVLPALAVTARFALKPIVDAILRLKEGGLLPNGAAAAGQELPLLTAEVRQLREEMAQLQQSVTRLQDAEAFHRTLEEPAPARSLARPRTAEADETKDDQER